MKKVYEQTTIEQVRSWYYDEKPEELYVDISLEFTRPLTPEERNRAVAHFVNGLDVCKVTSKYFIHEIDFSQEDILKIAFRQLEEDWTFALGFLLFEFVREFPAKPLKSLFDLDTGTWIDNDSV